VRLVIKGEVLEVVDPTIFSPGPYRVLRNDQSSLVAVLISPEKATDKEPLLDTETLLIDKRTGSHLVAWAVLDSPVPAPPAMRGTCIAK
jgi:hypothetical protein